MPKANPRRMFEAKFKKTPEQSASQTLKANATPRIGQGTRTKSAYHKFFQSKRSTYGQQTPNYNVGRTRRGY